MKRFVFHFLLKLIFFAVVVFFPKAVANAYTLPQCSHSLIKINSSSHVSGNTLYILNSCLKNINGNITVLTNVKWIGLYPWDRQPCSVSIKLFDVTNPSLEKWKFLGEYNRGNCQFGYHEYNKSFTKAIPGHTYLSQVDASIKSQPYWTVAEVFLSFTPH